MTPASKALYPLRVREAKVRVGNMVAPDQVALIVETGDGRRIALKCSQEGRVIQTVSLGAMLDHRQMFMVVETFPSEAPFEDKSDEEHPPAEERSASGATEAPRNEHKAGSKRSRKVIAASLILIAFAVLFLARPQFVSKPEPGNYAEIAEATCSGDFDGLKDLEAAAYREKSTSAMMWLRWLYVNESCRTYIGFGPEASKPLLAAADAGHATAAYTIGSYMMDGGGGFERDPQQAEKWLTNAVTGGNHDAARLLVDEYRSGRNLTENEAQAEKYISWLKSQGAPAWATGETALEYLTNSHPSSPSKAAAKSSNVPSSTKDLVTATAATPSDTTESEAVPGAASNYGETGDMIFAKVPLQRECWAFKAVKSAVSDSQMTVMWQNMLRNAKSESVLQHGSMLEIYNFFFFDADVHEILNPGNWHTKTAVAYKVSFYASNPVTECGRTFNSFESRDEMLANLYKYGPLKAADVLNWHRAPVPSDTLAELKSAGIVMR